MRAMHTNVGTIGTAGPAADASLPAPRRWPDATGAIPALDRARILVVGSPAEATDFAEALATMGHDAVAVHTAQAAMSVVHEWPVDIVFVDDDAIGDLPRFARRIYEIGGCEVVEITQHRTRYVGFSAHILKPLSLDTAEQLISSLRRG